jgi:hypothetical protein
MHKENADDANFIIIISVKNAEATDDSQWHTHSIKPIINHYASDD